VGGRRRDDGRLSEAEHVREAVPDDAEAIARVQVETWQTTYRGVVSDAYLDGMDVAERAARWRDRPDGRRAYVAEDNGVVVGFVAFGPCRDADASVRVGELYAIYVLPEWWRHGIGRALHGACVKDLRRSGFGEARLWVLEANPTARLFYEHLGWAWDGTVAPHDVGGQEHSIVRYRCPL
jgi:GNAT superfamily N-acetyltransferase